MRRVRLTVTGRVQGVYFRASTEQRARQLGLTGWVRNLPDGSVEVEAQGAEEGVAALIDWCHEGPAYARVAHVDACDIDVIDDRGFEVR